VDTQAGPIRSAYDAAHEILHIIRHTPWSDDVRDQIIRIRAEAGFVDDVDVTT